MTSTTSRIPTSVLHITKVSVRGVPARHLLFPSLLRRRVYRKSWLWTVYGKFRLSLTVRPQKSRFPLKHSTLYKSAKGKRNIHMLIYFISFLFSVGMNPVSVIAEAGSKKRGRPRGSRNKKQAETSRLSCPDLEGGRARRS